MPKEISQKRAMKNGKDLMIKSVFVWSVIIMSLTFRTRFLYLLASPLSIASMKHQAVVSNWDLPKCVLTGFED